MYLICNLYCCSFHVKKTSSQMYNLLVNSYCICLAHIKNGTTTSPTISFILFLEAVLIISGEVNAPQLHTAILSS